MPHFNAAGAGSRLFRFNGIDGSTGRYLFPPLTPARVAEWAKRDVLSRAMADDEAQRQHAADVVAVTQPGLFDDYGTRYRVDAWDIAQAGWGVIFSKDIDPTIIDALRPLLDLRARQAGGFYHEFVAEKGYVPGESKQQFLSGRGVGSDAANPEKMPYYLLIVGDPAVMPFAFQHQLDVVYAVGRLWLDGPEAYRRYAEAVVAAETGKPTPRRSVAFFAPRNPDDACTALSAEQLAGPLADLAEKAGGWRVTRSIGTSATHQALAGYLGGPDTPALLFTAGHGVGFPSGDPRQATDQGALVCQDWPGPTADAIERHHYFTAADIPDDADVRGLIAFHFACFSGGTPRLSDYPLNTDDPPPEVIPRAAVSALPGRLLGHPGGGALAVIGHVERAWQCSIEWQDAAQIQPFEDAIKALLDGRPVGYAMEFMNQRYATLAVDLLNDVREAQWGKPSNADAMEERWTAVNDARAFVVLGDPAVRLAVDGPRGELSPPAPRTILSRL